MLEEVLYAVCIYVYQSTQHLRRRSEMENKCSTYVMHSDTCDFKLIRKELNLLNIIDALNKGHLSLY